VPAARLVPSRPSATLRFGPKGVIGAFGEIHPKVLKDLDLKGPLVGFEITLDALPAPKHKPTKMKPKPALSEFQPVTRDFAFVVGREVAAGDVVRAAQAAERQLIAGIEVFDIYAGAGIEPDRKSVAIAVTLQPIEKTLTDAEIESVSQKIVGEVGRKTGAVLRG
jgi:phenylalanyl-tRNA synthetase beta chain